MHLLNAVKLEEQSQCPCISFTSSTELKSSSPFIPPTLTRQSVSLFQCKVIKKCRLSFAFVMFIIPVKAPDCDLQHVHKAQCCYARVLAWPRCGSSTYRFLNSHTYKGGISRGAGLAAESLKSTRPA